MTRNIGVIAQIARKVPFTCREWRRECVFLLCSGCFHLRFRRLFRHVSIQHFYNPTPILFSFIRRSKDHYGYSFGRGKNLQNYRTHINSARHFSMCSLVLFSSYPIIIFTDPVPPARRRAWGFHNSSKFSSIVSPSSPPKSESGASALPSHHFLWMI